MPTYLDCEVSLCHVTPRIWRRFLLRKAATFRDLHHAIQQACGWGNAHLFEFRAEGRRGPVIAGIPDDEFGEPAPDAKTVKLAAHFGPSGPGRCLYLYDFGDGWEHDVLCRGIVAHAGAFSRQLLDGRRAFPPEDCGSYPGYARCVQVARGAPLTQDERLDHFRRWLGDWDPERFDLKTTQAAFDR